MTGLDLESFLLLLRADLSTWTVVGLATLGLAFLVWSCWGSRRALRKCLVFSLAAHLGMVLYGSTVPAVLWAVNPDRRYSDDREHIRKIRVLPLVESTRPNNAQPQAVGAAMLLADMGRSSAGRGPLELAERPLALGDTVLHVDRPKSLPPAESNLAPGPKFNGPVPMPTATPEGRRRVPETMLPDPVADTSLKTAASAPPPPSPTLMDDVERTVPAPAPVDQKTAPSSRDFILRTDRRLRPEPTRASADGPVVAEPSGAEPIKTEADAKPRQFGPGTLGSLALETGPGRSQPIPLSQATPRPRNLTGSASGLAALGDRGNVRPLAEIPKVYQPRLDPDRSSNAQRIGATAASERAVDRALDWLARHQDRQDGRWNGGIARYDDGTPVKNDHDFTAHCPPGETCFGECAYWEADTALTGLALLTFLGAGYTQVDGRYAETVEKGLDFLVAAQKPDGDLRGESRVVGMYCHAMAMLALCEAYALTGDELLREPVERAVAFVARGRARDGLAWRYSPGAPVGDTSILGWIVMGLKSAKLVGISIPDERSVRTGTLQWLDKVAAGESRGLARYQPRESPTPTMTAEAWVCRQFLAVGLPGPASTEAAEFLLDHESDRGPTNFYYWYYATLALYQHGGDPWTRWNSKIRDRIVGLQTGSGHQLGSWDPDASIYGTKGGRIYCTTLAALTLEVYYRYLRLYDDPKIPIEGSQASETGPAGPGRTVPTRPAINPEDR